MLVRGSSFSDLPFVSFSRCFVCSVVAFCVRQQIGSWSTIRTCRGTISTRSHGAPGPGEVPGRASARQLESATVGCGNPKSEFPPTHSAGLTAPPQWGTVGEGLQGWASVRPCLEFVVAESSPTAPVRRCAWAPTWRAQPEPLVHAKRVSVQKMTTIATSVPLMSGHQDRVATTALTERCAVLKRALRPLQKGPGDDARSTSLVVV
jgi:hypothetical protein